MCFFFFIFLCFHCNRCYILLPILDLPPLSSLPFVHSPPFHFPSFLLLISQEPNKGNLIYDCVILWNMLSTIHLTKLNRSISLYQKNRELFVGFASRPGSRTVISHWGKSCDQSQFRNSSNDSELFNNLFYGTIAGFHSWWIYLYIGCRGLSRDEQQW